MTEGKGFWTALFNFLAFLVPGLGAIVYGVESRRRKEAEEETKRLEYKVQAYATAREELEDYANKVKDVNESINNIDPDLLCSMLQNLPTRTDRESKVNP